MYGNLNKKVAFFKMKKNAIYWQEGQKHQDFLRRFSLFVSKDFFGSQVTLPGFAAPFSVPADLAVLPQHRQHSLDFFFCIIWIFRWEKKIFGASSTVEE